MSILANKQRKQFAILSGIVLIMLMTVSSVQAQYTWVGTTGDINTASNWSPSGVPSAGNTYTFGNTGITTTVTGNPAPGVLIVVNSSAGVKDYTISGVLSGATTVTKNGSSKLTLTGTNTYSGITNVNAGILNIQNNSALGTTANGTVVAYGAILQMQNNITVTGEALTLNGSGAGSATGGTITTSGAYTIHTFTSSGTFTLNIGGTVEYLIVGGGGGGLGSDDNGEGGGGGGAGGVVYGSGTRTPGSYTVSVGAGGAGGIIEGDAAKGSNSVFGTLTALGGGGSTRQEAVPATANAGGSGAGGFGRSEAGGNATQPGSGSGGFGNAGGNSGANPGGGGGGGGANSAGSTGGANNGGNGGGGRTYDISGASVAYAGGGGGGVRLSGTAGTASAGGGAGGTAGNVGSNATPNTGGGGGGGGGIVTTYQSGGNGGSGIVIVRYLSTGALENVSGNNVWTGTVTMLADNKVTTTSGTLNISGVISGAYALAKNGSGTLTLSNANTYSGGTILSEGTLNINNASALGTVAGTFTIVGGTIDNTSGAAITTVNYPQAWNADFTFTGTNDLNLGTGAVTMSASRQVTTTANTLTIGGVINDNTKNLTKAGVGTLAFVSQAVTLNALTISAGTLRSTSGNLDLAGNFTNNAAFTHNSGSVRFVGSSASALSSSATTTFHNLTINNPGSVTMTAGTFQVANNMTFTNGVVNQNATLVILNGATATGASNLSHVNGLVRKTGNQAFTFPVGKNGFYRPISISAPSVDTDQFSAEYFNTPQSFGFSYLFPLDHVSGCEYWNLDRTAGSSNVSVTLTWNQAACPIYAITLIANMRVAYWNSSNWVDRGATSIIGNSTAGSVTSLAPVTQFGPFTLATNTALNVLPIQLTSFNAENKGAFVDVKWATSSEQNCDFFTVERSSDNITFESIGTVKGHGTTSLASKYSLIDNNIAGLTKAYYRLKQTDLDGRTQYFKTIKLSFNQSTKEYSIYPIPNNGQFTIRGNMQKVRQVYLLNTNGVLLRKLPLQAQQSIVDISPGMYVLQLVGDNITEHIKFIKY
jgi:autotransporter-associated beta strand protein